MLFNFQNQWQQPKNFPRQFFNTNNYKMQNTIRFEPFNKNDLQKIKSSVQNKFDINRIENSIQNEHNASIFYEHLLSMTNNDTSKTILTTIKNNCMHRKNILNEIYQSQSQNQYKVKDPRLNKFDNFSRSLAFAVEQESLVAHDLLFLIDSTNDFELIKRLNLIFNQKILDINSLNLLLHNAV